MKKIKTKYFLLPIAVCFMAVSGLLYFYFLTNFSQYDNTQYVLIDQDDDVDSVIAKMEPIAKKHSMKALRTLIRHTNYPKHIHTGRFAITANLSSYDVFRTLKSGRRQPMMLTIPECRTMDKLAAQLAKRLMLDSATIASALYNHDITAKYGYDTTTIACMFVPNTYEIYWDVSLDAFLKRMKKEHDNFWEGNRQAKASEMGLTPNEVCTLASIIDEETANNNEKPMIAGMYLNRLKTEMPLQADPTVKFAMKRFELKRIYHDMLFYDSPWNTYRNTGLPPGPIKVASVKGIDAVLNHANHDFLYMCAKDDFSGTHVFAHTYKEHLNNAAKYSKALNERGIK
jgi:UPF0755 protein